MNSPQAKDEAIVLYIGSVRIIEKCWIQYKDRQMFAMLKHAVCAAEHSLTHEILRKVVPKEAELLKEPLFKARVRFRFAGTEFPPTIVFKIFMKTEGKGVKYISGKKAIKPTSEAAVDSCKIMGNRKFYEQILSDHAQQSDSIADERDVTNMKEYMKYLTTLDELPATSGGKDNTWRRLTLEILPRHNIVYDIVNYFQTGRSSPILEEEFSVPYSRISTSAKHSPYIGHLAQNKKKTPQQKVSHTERRSQKARNRVAKMRRLYGLNQEEKVREGIEVNFESEDWDKEGQMLYEWTQELSFNNMLT